MTDPAVVAVARAYVGGSVAVAVAVAVLGWGAQRLRVSLLPGWNGAPARLAEIVTVLAVVLSMAKVLGSFGAFRPWPMLVAVLVGGLAMGAAASPVGRRVGPTPQPASRQMQTVVRERIREPVEERAAAALAAAVVGAQWVTHIGATYTRGMSQPDTLWYHAPFAARFVQTGWLAHASSTGLEGLASPVHTFLPLDSSLLHALVVLPFGNDFLSPLVNLAWAGVALLSAWCIGRRHGVGALCVLGAVVVLGIPTIVGTQPGQAGNDVACGALFLAAVALLLEGELQPVPTALAGLAAGIGLSVKLTVLASVGVITVGVVVLALRRRRPLAAALWCAGVAVSSAYWLGRDWLIADNPMPWFGFRLGPINLPAMFPKSDSIATYLADGSAWRRFFWPGLVESLGRFWPLTIALGIAGGALGVAWGRRPLERLLGGVVFVGLGSYLFTPHSGDLGGGVFVFTLRYLAPTLMLSFTLLAVAVAGKPTAWRRALWVALAVLVMVDAAASQHEGTKAWPGWLLPGLAGGAVVLAVVVGFAKQLRWLVPATVVAVLLWLGGWALQRHYLDQRYVRAGLDLDRINAVFQTVHGKRIALFGDEQTYPLFGSDLSNWVSKVDGPTTGTTLQQCRRWRQLLSAGRYDYVVLANGAGFVTKGPSPQWIASDPAARVVLDGRVGTIYRIAGRLAPGRCT